jgi:hypothetical protein
MYSISAPVAPYNRSRCKPKARPAIVVAALAPVVGILHARKIEIFFPVRPFLLQWRWAVADFHPAHGLVSAEARVRHIAEIFAFSNRALAERFILNGIEQSGFATRLHAGSHQIAHKRELLITDLAGSAREDLKTPIRIKKPTR